MIDHKIGGLPVVRKNRLVGILTTSDLLMALIDCEPSVEALEDIAI
jgi:CBS domain-containing protein